MLKLVVENTIAANPSLPIRWCLDEADLERVKDVKDPYLLIVAASGGEERLRLLVPLHTMMEYLHFSRSGEYTIYGVVVDGGEAVIRYYLGRNPVGCYSTNLIDRWGHDAPKGTLCEEWLGGNILNVAQIKVSVAGEFFAKEPSGWLKSWVNLWYESKPLDECHFRKRMILAFTVQPFCVTVWVLAQICLRLLIACWQLLLLGRPGVNFAAVVRIWKYDSYDVDANVDKSVFVYDREGKERHLLFHLFTPIVPMTVFLIAEGVNVFYLAPREQDVHWFALLGLSWLVPVAVSVAWGMLVLVSGILGWLLGNVVWLVAWLLSSAPKVENLLMRLLQQFLEKGDGEVKRRREEKRRQTREREFALRYQPIICTPCEKDMPLRVAALPRPQQTFRLKFQELKTHVCKRFAL